MPGSSNTSFIPKHTPTKAERKSTPRQLFLGTLLVRILFFAVLIASVGTFAYDRRVSSQLANEVAAFKIATQSFESDEQRLQTVLNIDRRLVQANNRILSSASFLAILTAFEAATAEAAQIKSLTISREDDDTITTDASITTNTFDSVMFQRSILERNDVLKVVEIQDVTIVDGTTQEGSLTSTVISIDFNAIFKIDPSAVTVLPRQTQPQPQLQVALPVVPPVSTTTVDGGAFNQESL